MNKILFSFDDNHKLNMKVADLFEKHGFTATFFINLTPMRQHESMSNEDIINLHERGFEIGAHAVFHRPLTKVLPEQAYYEITNSKELLQRLLGADIKGFCYPKGQYDQNIIKTVEQAGYTYARATGEGSTNVYRLNHQFEIVPTIQIYNSMLRRYLRIKRRILHNELFSLSGDWLDSCKRFIESSEGAVRIFGHAWEIDKQKQWGKLEELLQWIKDNDHEVVNEFLHQNNTFALLTLNIYTLGNIQKGMAEITLKGFQCERCGHKWKPRGKPLVCPKCKSPYWNLPKKEQ